MNTSISNGINVGKLPWDFIVTSKLYNGRGTDFNKKETKRLFDEIKQIKTIYFALERSKFYNDYHSHLLIESSDEQGFINGMKGFYKSSYMTFGNRPLLVKMEKSEKSLVTPVNFQDLWVNSPTIEIHGRVGTCFIEKIYGSKNAALYINKYSSRGFTTGYLSRDINNN